MRCLGIRYGTIAGRRFTTTLKLPEGCWRLSLRAVKTQASLVVQSLAVPAQPADCGATSLHSEAMPTLPPSRPWIRATTAGGTIYGSLFYDSPSTDQTLAIYAQGKAPAGVLRKIL